MLVDYIGVLFGLLYKNRGRFRIVVYYSSCQGYAAHRPFFVDAKALPELQTVQGRALLQLAAEPSLQILCGAPRGNILRQVPRCRSGDPNPRTPQEVVVGGVVGWVVGGAGWGVVGGRETPLKAKKKKKKQTTSRIGNPFLDDRNREKRRTIHQLSQHGLDQFLRVDVLLAFS